MAFPEDLSVFFDAAGGFAKPVVWGALTASGLLDMPAEDILGGRASSNEYLLTIPADKLPGITRGVVILVGGISYTTRANPELLGDGAIKTIALTRNN